MKRRYNRNGQNVRIIAVLIVPMLLITISNIGYSVLNDEINTIAEFESAPYDIEITDCKILYYNGYKQNPLLWTENDMLFFDNYLYPGWELIILTTIHNKAEEFSWVCVLDYTLYYWNFTTGNWTTTNEAKLQELFGITYVGEFFLDEGCTAPMSLNYELLPCTSVYHREHLIFNGLESAYIEEANFTMRASVRATYPTNDDPPEVGE